MFLQSAARNWWTLVVRGLLAIAFGILTITVPKAAVLSLVVVFGVYAIVEGVVELGMLRNPAAERKWVFGLAGLLSIAAGIIAFIWPGITAVALFYLIAWWAIALGIVEIVSAITYSDALENEWAYVISGLLWVGFGIILIVWPNLGVVTVLALIATAALLRGILLMVAGFRMRTFYRRVTTPLR
jgi:uncharacterized membrane protein HdeD (DUF308 family)